ncbi:MAG: cobalamin B12-binding domain-containing protein, partial [Rhodospirillaceae bacterium]
MESKLIERPSIQKSPEPVIRDFIERRGLGDVTELVLIQPPLVPKESFDPVTASSGGYFNYPPVGLLYIASAAKKVNPNLDIALVDLNHELLRMGAEPNFDYDSWKDLVRAAIDQRKAPMIGLTYMFGSTKVCFKMVSNFLREEYPHLTIVTGGVQATYDYKEILRDGLCDIV